MAIEPQPVVCIDCNGLMKKFVASRIKCLDCGAEFFLTKVTKLSKKNR